MTPNPIPAHAGAAQKETLTVSKIKAIVVPARDAISAFVDGEHGGDAAGAILAIARQYGVAVAYLDRHWFEEYLSDELGGKPFTDEQWGRIEPHLEDYDEHVGDTDDLNYEFVRSVLNKAGLGGLLYGEES